MSISAIQLICDSSTVGNGTPQDFTVNIPTGIICKDYELGLGELTMTYSWNNISAAQGNNTIGYRTAIDNSSKYVTIPDGNYTLSNINSVFQQAINSNGDVGTNISISSNFQTIKTNVLLSNGYCLDLTVGSLYVLLGFTSGVLISTQGVTASPNDGNITTVNTVLVHCNLITGNYYNGVNSDILYAFPPAYLPGSLIAITPLPVVFNRISQQSIYNIRLYITDDSNQILNLNSQPVTITLYLRQCLPPGVQA
jgi:hypothetical protein